LTGAAEVEGKQWAAQMKDFPVEIKRAVDREKALGLSYLEPARIQTYRERFEEILQAGYKEYPERLIPIPISCRFC
jgi:CRISPR/Cas system-associated exonuclease Cas4 (RecB family)